MEHRVNRLEEHVGDLRAQSATHREVLRSQQDSIDELTNAVKELTAVLNKGRGAIWLMGLCAGAVGAFGGWCYSLLHNGQVKP